MLHIGMVLEHGSAHLLADITVPYGYAVCFFNPFLLKQKILLFFER